MRRAERIRKMPVAALAVTAVLLTAGMMAPDAARAAKNNKGVPIIPLVVQNQSGSSKDLYVYIQGVYDGDNYRVKNTGGDIKKLTSTDGKYKTWGLNLGTASKTKIKIPQLTAARVYLSFGKGMKILVSGSGAPSTPVGWSTSDKNYNTLFDWVEYTWTPQENPPVPGRPGSAINANATQVDMLGLPMLIKMFGIDANSNSITTKAGFSKAGARSKVFNDLNNAGKPWKKLVVKSGNGTKVRAVSPYNGMKLGTFPSDQLDSYIDDVYSTYEADRNGKTMTAKTNAGGVDATFTAQVTNDNLIFVESGRNNSANTVSFAKPTSMQAYEGFPGTVPGNASSTLQAQAGQIETYVQAAFMRTTMLTKSTISNCPSTSAYYKNAPVNEYGKSIHKRAFKHQAYAFGYDDVCDQASDYTVFAPMKVSVKIIPFDAD